MSILLVKKIWLSAKWFPECSEAQDAKIRSTDRGEKIEGEENN